MNKYRRVRTDSKEDTKEKSRENEIKLNSSGYANRYVSYALSLFNRETDPATEVTFRGLGNVIPQTITVAEVVKRRVHGLHQHTQIDSVEIEEIYEPLEAGLRTVINKRYVPSILITLSKTPGNTNDPGYQTPLHPSEVHPEGSRAKSGKNQDAAEDEEEEDDQAEPRRGRGRGRGRGGRGRGGRGGRGRGGRGRGGRGRGGRGRGGRGGASNAGDDNGAAKPPRGRGGRGRGGRGRGSRGGNGGNGGNGGRGGRGRGSRGGRGGNSNNSGSNSGNQQAK